VQFTAQTDSIAVARLQSDGKLLLLGSRVTGTAPKNPDPSATDVGGRAPTELFVKRLNADGSPDVTFGASGETTLVFDGSEIPGDMVVQDDQQIVLSARTSVPCYYVTSSTLLVGCNSASGIAVTPKNVMTRLTASGVMDTNFGFQGVAIVAGDWRNNHVLIAIQPDQKPLLLVSWYTVGSYGTFYYGWSLQRFTTNGTTDTAFNQGQAVVSRCATSGSAVAVGSDGRIVVAGGRELSYSSDPTTLPGICVESFDSTGSPDTAFNNGQTVSLPQSANLRLSTLKLLDDGRIVLVGYGWPTNADPCYFYGQRLLRNGSLDTSFGSGGTVRTSLPQSSCAASSSLLSSDGSIVVAGWVSSSADAGAASEPAWVRWTDAGQADTDFSANGLYLQSTVDALPAFLLADATGRWIIVGSAATTDGGSVGVVTRTKGDTP
jgi:uncharacterized delta-60 repeat protein